MPSLLTKLYGEGEVIKVLHAGLVSNRVKHIVVVRRNSLDLYYLDQSSKLKLRKKIPVFDNVLDCAIFDPLGESFAQWLVFTTDSNKLIIVAFKQDLKHIVINITPLKTKGMNGNLSIVPNTLSVDPQNHISFHTREGTLCVYELYKASDMKNFKKTFEVLSGLDNYPIKELKLLNDPAFYDISRNKLGLPISLESITPHPLTNNEKTFSILYRNDVYEYYSDFLTVRNGKTTFRQNYRFTDDSDMSSVVLQFQKNLGVLYFTSESIVLKLFDPLVPYLELDKALQKANGSTINPLIGPDGKARLVSKSVFGLDKKISAGLTVNTDLHNTSLVLFTDGAGKLYTMRIVFETQIVEDTDEDLFTDIQKLDLKGWEVHEIENCKLNPNINDIVQISNNEFLFSSQLGLELLKVDINSRTFDILDSSEATPPILDFSLSGKNAPKLQTVGASDFDSGFIKTEFKGFEKKNRDRVKLKTTGKINISSFWKVSDTLIVKELVGPNFRSLDISGPNAFETELTALSSLSGSIIDLKVTSSQSLLVVTDSGIYQDGKLIKEDEVINAVITDNDEVVYNTSSSLVWREINIKQTEEISCISALKHKKQSFILVGNWDGSVDLYINQTKKQIQKSNLAIKSVFIKKLLNNELIFIIGDGEGNMTIINEDLEVNIYEIGTSPVDIIDYKGNSVIASNSENVIKFDLSNKGTIEQRGYLKIDPERVILKFIQGILYCLTDSKYFDVVDIDPEIQKLTNLTLLPKLVRKATKFQNYLNMSVFITLTKTSASKLIKSSIQVIENNTFETKSILEFDEGIEITDIVNLKYRKDLIDSYNEEDISIAYQNVLSQCFVISCISHVQDTKIPVLQLFSVDETGKIQKQCSSAIESSDFKIFSLTNHSNRLVVGAGNVVVCYKVEYSVVDSKFSINRVSSPYKPKFFISCIKSFGPDLLIVDVVEGLKKLRLKVEDVKTDGVLIFSILNMLSSFDFPRTHFITNLEVSDDNIVITSDSLGNICIFETSEDSFNILSRFGLGDRCNVIKKIENHVSRSNNSIIPTFLLGTYSGCIYLISRITDDETYEQYSSLQDQTLTEVEAILTSRVSPRNLNPMRQTRETTDIIPSDRLIDGDLLVLSAPTEISNLIKESTSIL